MQFLYGHSFYVNCSILSRTAFKLVLSFRPNTIFYLPEFICHNMKHGIKLVTQSTWPYPTSINWTRPCLTVSYPICPYPIRTDVNSSKQKETYSFSSAPGIGFSFCKNLVIFSSSDDSDGRRLAALLKHRQPNSKLVDGEEAGCWWVSDDLN